MAKPKKSELPSTLQRSPEKIQDTFAETLDAAEDTYDGDEARAHRTAWASVKHVAEKKGDHWEVKDEYGPSDEQSALTGEAARRGDGRSAGGVDAAKTKAELLQDAREADVAGRSKMTKDELVEALRKSNDRATARARRKD